MAITMEKIVKIKTILSSEEAEKVAEKFIQEKEYENAVEIYRKLNGQKEIDDDIRGKYFYKISEIYEKSYGGKDNLLNEIEYQGRGIWFTGIFSSNLRFQLFYLGKSKSCGYLKAKVSQQELWDKIERAEIQREIESERDYKKFEKRLDNADKLSENLIERARHFHCRSKEYDDLEKKVKKIYERLIDKVSDSRLKNKGQESHFKKICNQRIKKKFYNALNPPYYDSPPNLSMPQYQD